MRIIRSLLILIVPAVCSLAAARQSSTLRLVQTIPLDEVSGRIDHLAVDRPHNRLFVAALGSNSVVVVDLAAGKITRSIPDLAEPQGVCYLPDLNILAVTEGGSGSCRIYDASSFKLLRTAKLPEDADNIRYDKTKRVLMIGAGAGALFLVDPQSGAQEKSIPLPAHPESFQLDTGTNRIFVNVPDAHGIAVIDRRRMAVETIMSPGSARANFPMAIDEAHHRMFVACRRPARLLVFATDSLRQTAAVTIAGDADDLWYDTHHARIYLSCGEGSIDVIAEEGGGAFRRIEKIPTAPGARTSLFVPESNRLFLAVPARGDHRAEIRIYEIVG